MLIGTYICATGIVYLLTLLALALRTPPDLTARRAGKHLVRFSIRSFLLGGAGLAAFLGLSAWAGILRFGRVWSYRVPQDYIALGIPGWVILSIVLLGMFTPLAAALWADYRR